MSGGVSAPRSGAGNWDVQPDPIKVDVLVQNMRDVTGIAPGWLGFIDNDSTLKQLADQLLAGGTIDGEGAVRLVQEAKDFGKITPAEQQVFVNLLREHGGQFAPEAREALSRFFDIPLTRPSGEVPVIPRTPATPPATPAAPSRPSGPISAIPTRPPAPLPAHPTPPLAVPGTSRPSTGAPALPPGMVPGAAVSFPGMSVVAGPQEYSLD
ncbi:MAG TPA: hypothetical protein VHF22_00490, partial [Planctomycetota bacterium]|nr:hypothetical protein [Planctomycetota bacterium]